LRSNIQYFLKSNQRPWFKLPTQRILPNMRKEHKQVVQSQKARSQLHFLTLTLLCLHAANTLYKLTVYLIAVFPCCHLGPHRTPIHIKNTTSCSCPVRESHSCSVTCKYWERFFFFLDVNRSRIHNFVLQIATEFYQPNATFFNVNKQRLNKI